MHSLSRAIRILAASQTAPAGCSVVGRVHEAGRRRAQRGLERPDLHGVTALAGRDLEAGHGPTLCQYSGSRVRWIRAAERPENGKSREWARSLHVRFGALMCLGERPLQPAPDQHRDTGDHRLVRDLDPCRRLSGPRPARVRRTGAGGREAHVRQPALRPRTAAAYRRPAVPDHRRPALRRSRPTVRTPVTS